MARAEAYLHTKWHLDPSSYLATTAIGRKLGAVPHWERASWVPIQRSVARVEAGMRAEFHLDPSNRLATVHQRYTVSRTRQTGQDRQRSDSIGQTVLQTGAKKAVINYFSSTALTVARYGHAADLFFTPRAHVNNIYVRTSSSTCERGVLCANVDMVHVRTSTMSTCARRTPRLHV